MTAADNALSPPYKLAIWRTVKAGYGHTARNFGAFLTAAALPLALTLLVAAVMADAPQRRSLTMLHSLLDIMIAAVFQVTWYRHLLFGTPEARPRLLPRPGRRLGPYLGYAWFLGALSFPALFVIGPPGAELGSTSQIILAVLLLVLALYLNIRFAFAFLWISIDEPGRLETSWRQTRGNGWRLFIVFVLIAIPILGTAVIGIALTQIFFPEALPGLLAETASGAPFWIGLAAEQALTYVLYGVSSAAFVHALQSLTGWAGNQQEILERFE
ncbi:MAG TPA: hypothetical protein EYH07_00280 [Kiloniellaceae bacterium]|nr:hypothetical protein [Kiloniellaceae bacterium]HIP76890.1 hypothetical protein [Kiloniellaceae bacterium]